MRKFRLIPFLILLAIMAFVEYYTFTAIKFSLRTSKVSTRNTVLLVYGIITVLWFLTFLLFPVWSAKLQNKFLRNVLISFSMGLLIAKFLIAVVLFLDDIRRVIFYISGLFYGNSAKPQFVESGMSRAEFINKLALILGGGLFSTMVIGMTNRYNYKIRNIALSFANLPNAFKGLKIVQISDVHSGSLNNKEAVMRGIDLILDQKPDLIFFTGDLVNDRHEEMKEYHDIFAKLTAPLGVYSITGNHDYGDYIQWESQEAKYQNFNNLVALHKSMGWDILMDEHRVIERNGEKIAVVGVQNISGKGRFHSYGSLAKAHTGSEDIPFKILLSHDPSHWDSEVNKAYKDIDLTLSGHTHGMQFGIEIPGIKWSPVKYIYKQWAGLYQEGSQYLYVNRGFGFLGYPGRVGIMPEITVFELS